MKLVNPILKFTLSALLLASLLWYVIEIPLLEHCPAIYKSIFHKTIYPVEIHPGLGVPFVSYPDIGKYYNPLFVANQICLDAQCTEHWENRQRFLNCTDWLKQKAVLVNDIALFPYEFDFSAYNLKKPWYSALAQAKIMNALYCRYEFKQDAFWLELSGKTLKSLIPNDSIGISLYLSSISIWFHEYPGQPHSYVLNGMMATLLELNKYYISTSDSLAQYLFDQGYKALLEKLPEFDSYGGSRYDLLGSLASMSYHRMHISQLKDLSAVRPHPILQKFIRRWNFYRLIPAPIQLLANFKLHRFLAFAVLWVILLVIELVLWQVFKKSITKSL